MIEVHGQSPDQFRQWARRSGNWITVALYYLYAVEVLAVRERDDLRVDPGGVIPESHWAHLPWPIFTLAGISLENAIKALVVADGDYSKIFAPDGKQLHKSIANHGLRKLFERAGLWGVLEADEQSFVSDLEVAVSMKATAYATSKAAAGAVGGTRYDPEVPRKLRRCIVHVVTALRERGHALGPACEATLAKAGIPLS